MSLKPCPICSGEAILSKAVVDRTGYYCKCYECGKSTDEFASSNEAEEVWNRSEAADLKDYKLRGMYAIIMKPFKTWWQVFIRFLFLILGPVVAVTIISTLQADIMNAVLFIGMGLGCAFWLVLASYFFIRFSRRHYSAVRRLLKKERLENLIATVFAYHTVLCVYIALIIFILIPFIEACRNGKAFFS